MDEISRFWSKVDRSAGPDGCWLWKAYRDRQGYGIGTFSGKSRRAARIAYFLHNGTWPSECALHTCDNPPCVNPRHIINGTNADNVADRVRKGREGNRSGEKNSQARLTEEQVKRIREIHASQGLYLKHLAEMFDVSLPTVHKVVTRRTWKHVH